MPMPLQPASATSWGNRGSDIQPAMVSLYGLIPRDEHLGIDVLLGRFLDLRHLPPEQALAFLLRCHKGRFYRNRYPSLSLVQSGPT